MTTTTAEPTPGQLPCVYAEVFLAQFDPMVFDKLVGSIKACKATALVCFENHMLDSSQLGSRTAMCVGPECTYKTPEGCAGKHLHDLPSQRQYAQNWCPADEILKYIESLLIAAEPVISKGTRMGHPRPGMNPEFFCSFNCRQLVHPIGDVKSGWLWTRMPRGKAGAFAPTCQKCGKEIT